MNKKIKSFTEMNTDYELLQTGLAGVDNMNTIKVEFKGITKKLQTQDISKGREETKLTEQKHIKDIV